MITIKELDCLYCLVLSTLEYAVLSCTTCTLDQGRVYNHHYFLFTEHFYFAIVVGDYINTMQTTFLFQF